MFDERMGGGSVYNHRLSELGRPWGFISAPQTLLSMYARGCARPGVADVDMHPTLGELAIRWGNRATRY